MERRTGGRGPGGPDIAIWLSPGARLESLGGVLGRLASRVHVTTDMGELAHADEAHPRHLILDAEALPLEDVGYVRRFLATATSSRATVVGLDAGTRVARALLALPRTSWMAWPPDLDAILALAGATHGIADAEPDADHPATARRRGGASKRTSPPAASGETTSPISSRNKTASSRARTAEDDEIAQIQAILEGGTRELTTNADDDDGSALDRDDVAGLDTADPDHADFEHADSSADGAAVEEEEDEFAEHDFDDEDFDFDEDLDDDDIEAEVDALDDDNDDSDKDADEDADDAFEIRLRDGDPIPDPRSSLAPDPRDPPRASATVPPTGTPTSAAKARSHTPASAAAATNSADAGPFDAEFEVAFRDVPVAAAAPAPRVASQDAPPPGAPTRGDVVSPTSASAMRSEADTQTSPGTPKMAPPWWRAQVADLADAAQKLQLSMEALRASGPDDDEVRERVDELDAEVARIMQFARTLGYLAAPPSRGQQVFDLSDTVQLFVAQLASRPGGAPRCQFRALEPVYVRSDRSLIGTAFDAFFWLAGACSQGGDLVRAQVKRDDGWAEVRVEFPAGPLAGFDTTTILEPYGVRRILPDLGANALAAASAIVFGQGGATTLTSFPSGRLGWRIVLPLVDAPKR